MDVLVTGITAGAQEEETAKLKSARGFGYTVTNLLIESEQPVPAMVTSFIV